MIFAILFGVTKCMELKNGAYENLVVKIQDNVPQEKCTQILENLEVRNDAVSFIKHFRMLKYSISSFQRGTRLTKYLNFVNKTFLENSA